MASELLTFANYSVERDGLDSIYSIGAIPGERDGVVKEIAQAFGYELQDEPNVQELGGLIGQVGPAKELQENIGRVQEALGTNDDAVALARGWVERSGLLIPVQRSYITAEALQEAIDLAVISGGVRNWIRRRADRLAELNKDVGVYGALLVAGNRPMKTSEGPDVEEGMTEADYMREVILPDMNREDIPTTLIAPDTGTGDQVMTEGVRGIVQGDMVDFESGRIAVVSNAGAWVQNAGQFRRAVMAEVFMGFDYDGDRLVAVSDSFPLGTGSEPASSHQNPFSATGQILRNAQELVRHTIFR